MKTDIFDQLNAIARAELEVRLQYLELIRTVSPDPSVSYNEPEPDMVPPVSAVAVKPDDLPEEDLQASNAPQLPFISWLLAKLKDPSSFGKFAVHVSSDQSFPMTSDVDTMRSYVREHYTVQQKNVFNCAVMQYTRWCRRSRPCD